MTFHPDRQVHAGTAPDDTSRGVAAVESARSCRKAEANITATPINCPDCGDSINNHEYEGDYARYMCGGAYGDCDCRLSASHIARALLTAEPTDREVEAAAGMIQPRAWSGRYWPHRTFGDHRPIEDLIEEERAVARFVAREALRAAKGLA